MASNSQQGGDWAFVLPENNQFFNIVQNQQARADKMRLLEEERLREQKKNEGLLAATVGDAFNDKDYATGTQYDPLMRNKLGELRAKYAAEIKQNPNMSQADLQFRIQKDMSKWGGLAAGLKNYRLNLRENIKNLEQLGINPAAAEKLAIDKALYKTENGQKVLKDPDEIDFSKDYTQEVMSEYPELLVNSNEAFNKFLGKAPVYETGGVYATEDSGVTRKYKADLALYPFQELATDEKGRPLTQNGRPFVRTKAQKVTIGNQQLEVADPQTYQNAISDPAINLALNADLKAATGGRVNPNSEEGQIMKSALLLKRLQGITPKRNKFDDIQSESSLKERLDAGITINVGGDSKDEKNQKKLQEKFYSTGMGVITKALMGDGSVTGMKTKTGDKYDGFMDITQAVGDFVVEKDGDDKVKLQNIQVDPKRKILRYRVEDGEYKTISGEQNIKTWLKTKIGLNGIDMSEVNAVFGESTPRTQSQPASQPAKPKKSSGISWK